MEKPFFIKDNIGKNVLLKFGDTIQEVVISHLSPNEQAVYIQYTGETTGRWMTVERFSEAFFDFAPEIQKVQTA